MMQDTELYKRMGARIRQRRLELGWTQVEASLILQIPQTTLSDYETGSRRARLGRIVEIASRYKTTPCELAFGVVGGSR
jgi:transcriptional regulator with XRE-family HTH domain